MRLSKNVVRFRLGQVPAVGNVETGAIVGLSGSGAALCDAMAAHDVPEEDVPADCVELVAYMRQHGFIEDGAGEGAVHLGRARLRSAYLHVTNRCNLSCVGCYSRDEGRNRDEDPTFDQLAHAVDVLAELGVEQLIVSGGEPFLREDLAELAAHAKQGGIATVIILTNGMLCTDERIAPLAGKVDTISVSFDGPSSQSPSYIRGKQLFDRLVEVIKRIKGAGIQAHILPTIHAKNIDDVPAYLELGKQLGATVGFSLLSLRIQQIRCAIRSLGLLCPLSTSSTAARTVTSAIYAEVVVEHELIWNMVAQIAATHTVRTTSGRLRMP